MFDLSFPEMAVFILVVIICVVAAVIGILQLFRQGEKLRRSLLALVSLAVSLEAVILIFRAITIKAVPLTGLFESMIVLTIVFSLIYLFLSIAIHRVWFASVMVWVMLLLVLMSGIVAEPASQAHEAASTPWAIAHAIAMILGGDSIAFIFLINSFIGFPGKHQSNSNTSGCEAFICFFNLVPLSVIPMT